MKRNDGNISVICATELNGSRLLQIIPKAKGSQDSVVQEKL